MGLGICFVTVGDDGREVIETIQPQGHQGATNQQMELLACIQTLRELRGKRPPVDRWLRVQRMYRYKIEVVSLDSPYCGDVDDFSSELMLSAGHPYDVRLNDNPKNPRVGDVYGEIIADAS